MRSRRKFAAAGLLAMVAMISGCEDNADVNGDGKVSRTERAEEMSRDGYLPMQPGEWDVRMVVADINVPNLGASQREQIKEQLSKEANAKSCLSKDEAAKPGADFFGGDGTENCTYKAFDIAGNRAKMALSCGMGGMGKADMVLDGTVGETEFEFDTKLTMDVPLAGKIEISGTTIGKHQGKCPSGT
jgi:hypothetical protein